jgi:hypothetical protein
MASTPGADVLADFGDDDANHAVGGRAQNRFLEAPLEDGERGLSRRARAQTGASREHGGGFC